MTSIPFPLLYTVPIAAVKIVTSAIYSCSNLSENKMNPFVLTFKWEIIKLFEKYLERIKYKV